MGVSYTALSIGSGYNLANLNVNFTNIETAFTDALSRTLGGQMEAELDMNSNKVVNLATPTGNTDAATKLYVDDVIAGGGGKKFNSTTSDPLITSDINSGYSTGSIWVNETSDSAFVCVDSTVGAAVWTDFNPTAAEIKTLYESNSDTNEFSDAEQTKLASAETGATADQSGAEIKAAYEAEANAFTDTKNTKLSGIETAADVTDTINVASAGAVMTDGSAAMTNDLDIDGNDINNIIGVNYKYRTVYVDTAGSDSNDGFTVGLPVATLGKAFTIVSDNSDNGIVWTISVDTGSYTLTSTLSLSSAPLVKLLATGGLATVDCTAVTVGISVESSALHINDFVFDGATVSGVQAGINGFIKATDSQFNNCGAFGFDTRNGGRSYITSCIADGNTTSGYYFLNGGKGSVFNSSADGNGRSGVTFTNQSVGYVDNCTFDLNVRNGVESAGSSTLYGKDIDVTNGSTTAAAYLSSGSALMYLHTCSATDCGRPFMAEYGAWLNGVLLTADHGVSINTTYSAFYAENDGNITIVTPGGSPSVIDNFETAFKAEHNSRITVNSPSLFTLTGVTIPGNPKIGVVGNDNSYISMDNLLSASEGQEGTYTPTLTDVSNGGSPTPNSTHFRRDGDTVHVWGQINRGSITGGSLSQMRVSLPIASNITGTKDIIGSACSTSSSVQQRCNIYGDGTNDEAILIQDSSTTLGGAAFLTFSFIYKIL